MQLATKEYKSDPQSSWRSSDRPADTCWQESCLIPVITSGSVCAAPAVFIFPLAGRDREPSSLMSCTWAAWAYRKLFRLAPQSARLSHHHHLSFCSCFSIWFRLHVTTYAFNIAITQTTDSFVLILLCFCAGLNQHK